MNILKSIFITFSLFTIIPVPTQIKWTKERMSIAPLILPFVGVVIGILGSGIYYSLQSIDINMYAKSVFMVIYFIVITGGFHIDALMDFSDGLFSRKDKESKLLIMKDPNVGAFAVISFVVFIMLKTAVIIEWFSLGLSSMYIIFIPVISRLYLSIMISNLKFAKKDGLARIYGENINKKIKYILYFMVLALFLISAFYMGDLIIPSILIIGALFYIIWKVMAYKNFGGITGDILGAFLEIEEVIFLYVVWIQAVIA